MWFGIMPTSASVWVGEIHYNMSILHSPIVSHFSLYNRSQRSICWSFRCKVEEAEKVKLEVPFLVWSDPFLSLPREW